LKARIRRQSVEKSDLCRCLWLPRKQKKQIFLFLRL
jgi:hypothetical protein